MLSFSPISSAPISALFGMQEEDEEVIEPIVEEIGAAGRGDYRGLAQDYLERYQRKRKEEEDKERQREQAESLEEQKVDAVPPRPKKEERQRKTKVVEPASRNAIAEAFFRAQEAGLEREKAQKAAEKAVLEQEILRLELLRQEEDEIAAILLLM